MFVACVVMARVVMACVVMACIVMSCKGMACKGMACIVVAYYSYGLDSSGPYNHTADVGRCGATLTGPPRRVAVA